MPEPQPKSWPERVASLGILIPTYNRADHLWKCLEHLELQTMQDFEVIIVDDGSIDDTEQRVAEFQRRKSLTITYLRQSNSGPARARNLGIARTKAPLCLMIGDDIFCAPDMARLHLEFHRLRPQRAAVALGLTVWSKTGQIVTPYMEWIGMSGVQFGYGDLLNGVTPTWRHFYTSNLSGKTNYLRENPFYEGFARAGMEDIELGYRLSRNHGLEMSFLPEAVAEHLHPTTFAQGCKRAIHVGAAEYTFGELWPEQRAVPPRGIKRLLFPVFSNPRFTLPALAAVTALVTRFCCPNPLLPRILRFYGIVGFRRAAAAADRKHTEPLS